MYDVIIVGAGPAGSYLASRLAGAGHRVLVLEKKGRPTEPVCTGIVSQECVRHFDIEEKLILQKLNSATIFSPSGISLHLRREETQACVLDRPAFDKTLAAKARQAGAELRFGNRVISIDNEKGRTLIKVSQLKREETVSARVAVIATGFSPNLIKSLGLGTFKDYAFGAQAVVEAPGIEEVQVYFGNVAPGFFAWLVPFRPPLVKAGLISRSSPSSLLRKWLAGLSAEGKIRSQEVKISCKVLPLQPPHRTYGERLIAIGDAAGHVKPTTGGGIYYGLIGAEMACNVLQDALADDDLSARRLSRYERSWRQKLGREIKTGHWGRELFERLSERQIDLLFEIIRSAGIDEALLKASDISFDWHSRSIIALLKYRLITQAIRPSRWLWHSRPR